MYDPLSVAVLQTTVPIKVKKENISVLDTYEERRETRDIGVEKWALVKRLVLEQWYV